MVLFKNIGLRDAIATWRSAHDAFDVHEFLHATLTSRPSWAAWCERGWRINGIAASFLAPTAPLCSATQPLSSQSRHIWKD